MSFVVKNQKPSLKFIQQKRKRKEVDDGSSKSELEMQIVTLETQLESLQALAEKVPSDKKLPLALKKVKNTMI